MIQRNTQSKNTIKECFFTHAFFSSVFFTVLWSPFCVYTSPHFVDISPLIFILLSVLLPFLFHSPLLVPPGFLLVHYNFPSLYKAAPSPLHLSPHLLCPPVPLSLASFTLPSSVPSALHPSIPLCPSLSLIYLLPVFQCTWSFLILLLSVFPHSVSSLSPCFSSSPLSSPGIYPSSSGSFCSFSPALIPLYC